MADWLPVPQTQPRSSGSQPANGETIFFQGLDEFPPEFYSHPQLGLQTIDSQPETSERVVLWMRDGDPTLRAITIGENPPAKRTKRIPQAIESAEESAAREDFRISQPVRERLPASRPKAASPLKVWTLWANPLRG